MTNMPYNEFPKDLPEQYRIIFSKEALQKLLELGYTEYAYFQTPISKRNAGGVYTPGLVLYKSDENPVVYAHGAIKQLEPNSLHTLRKPVDTTFASIDVCIAEFADQGFSIDPLEINWFSLVDSISSEE